MVAILGKEPCNESGGRGGETINPRGNAVVVAVAINTAAVAGIGKGVRIVHPPAAIDRRPPLAALSLLLPSVCARDEDGDDEIRERRRQR